jgi:nucleoside 2-deoxyribosyltransferase
MNIYLASSWRNTLQPEIVRGLRNVGCEVYDFRNPSPGNTGFNWREIDPNWQQWTPQQYRDALKHPIAVRGFNHDMAALLACDACVLLLPSGRSASWEFGFALGQGKRGAVVMLDQCEPELMYLGNPILTSHQELYDWAATQLTSR